MTVIVNGVFLYLLQDRTQLKEYTYFTNSTNYGNKVWENLSKDKWISLPVLPHQTLRGIGSFDQIKSKFGQNNGGY